MKHVPGLAVFLLLAACGPARPDGPPLGEPGTLPVAEIRRSTKGGEWHVVLAPPAPLGLDGDLAELVPANNPLTRAKIELGSQLFFDARLSGDGTVACATCHHPATAWARSERFSTGVDGASGTRNVPALVNRILGTEQGWDGRGRTIEEQVLLHLANPVEMDSTLEDVAARLNEIEGYRLQFEAVFGGPASGGRIARALAAFTRTLVAGGSKHDYHREPAGDGSESAGSAPDPEGEHRMTEDALRGRVLFLGKAGCSRCHSGQGLSDERYHNTGVGMQGARPDLGRHLVTGNDRDRGAFKTPTLRNVARTAPYMHDGSFATLGEVIAHYDRGGTPNEWLSDEIVPLELSHQERLDLVAFLEDGLTVAPVEFVIPRLP